MSRKRSPKTVHSGLDDWANAETVPRAGLPDAVKIMRRAKLYRVVVWSAVVLFPFALLAVFLSGSGATVDSPGGSGAATPGRAVATAAVVDWLAGDPPPLPGGVLLGWSGVTILPAEKAANTQSSKGRVIEIDHFSLIDASGNLYVADVEVATDPRGGAVVLDGPSLIPQAPPANDGWQDGPTWPGLTTVQPPAPVTQSVSAWASAYTSGDSDALRLAVGDPSANNSYTPLTGITSATTNITSAAWLNGQTTMVARVVISPSWETAATDENSDSAGGAASSTTKPPEFTLDVLVERANTASPVVTAWGGPGMGPALVRYGNAVTGGAAARPASTTTTTSPPPTTKAPTTTTPPTTTKAPAKPKPATPPTAGKTP